MKYNLAEIERALGDSKSDSPLVQLAQQVGLQEMETIINILAGPVGAEIYIPSFENFLASIIRSKRDADIIDGYDGTAGGTKRLAQEFNLKPRRIQQIIEANRARGKA